MSSQKQEHRREVSDFASNPRRLGHEVREFVEQEEFRPQRKLTALLSRYEMVICHGMSLCEAIPEVKQRVALSVALKPANYPHSWLQNARIEIWVILRAERALKLVEGSGTT